MRQFSTLLSAGIPITRCMDILEKSTTSIKLRAALYKIKQQLAAGHPLSHGLQQTPEWFDDLSCQLIQLGEKTGKLDTILASLADYHEKKSNLQRKIMQALLYPCVLSMTALGLTLCMVIFVIPSFATIFRDTTSTLPILTRAIFAFTRMFNQHLIFLCAACISVLTACWHYHTRGLLQAQLYALAKRIPHIHRCLHTLSLLRFTRNLGIALSAGISILPALHQAASICGQGKMAQSILDVRAKVTTGVTLHHAMSSHSIFPSFVLQMVKVGEESGSLDSLLTQTANLLESQLESDITLLIQLLEPLIMLVQGVLIGGLVIGMYLPVFNLGSAL